MMTSFEGVRVRRKAVWLGVLAALAASVVIAGQAAAHASLVSSDPEDGAVLAEPPDEVVLEFDEAVQPDFTQVAVLDAEETHYEDGTPEVDGSIITQPVADMPAGDYRISYRAGSADAHPVTGVIAFTVESAGGNAAGEPATDEGTPDEPAASKGDASEGGTAADGAAKDDDATPVATVAATMAAIAALGIATVLLMRRRPGSAGDDDAPPVEP